MKKQKNNKGPLIFIAIFVAVIVIALLIKFYFIPTKTYHSKTLKISIDVPNDYSIEEGTVSILLKKKNNTGEILLFKIGTNSDNLEGYLLDIVNYNHLRLTNKENIKINNLQVIKVDINGKRNYLFYTKYRVYSLEASSKDLNSDLDRIARSFRYEP